MEYTSTTNQNEDSCTTITLGCDYMWSLAQHFAYTRLCDKKGEKSSLAYGYHTRARRIAATYARFYLETEQGGKLYLKGRYYWMALGAFASKTVACSLEDVRVASLSPVQEGLGKGNFWLFMDIAAWHWYWSNQKSSFNLCRETRGKECCVPQVNQILNKMPWASEALPKIDHFKANKNIREGMELVEKIEHSTSEKRPPIQLKHLLAIANHEQGNVLQPLIYDNPKFSRWINVQRWPGVKRLSPDLKIVFSNACELPTEDSRLESIAPEDTILENFQSRMKWIEKVAEKFHGLMQGFDQDNDSEYMEQELHTIAGWVNRKDPDLDQYKQNPMLF